MNNWRQPVKMLCLLCGLVAAIPVHAEVVNLTYTPATEWTDGSPLALSNIRSTRLFCDGVMVDGGGGAPGTFNPDLAAGTYTCYATHTVTLAAFLVKNPARTSCTNVDPLNPDACESARSNEITEIVGAAVEITVGEPSDLTAQ